MDRKYLEAIEELGLEPNFTLKELRKKWLELLKKYHPDRYQTEDESTIKFAEEKIIKINEAYNYLKENFEENKENDLFEIKIKDTSYSTSNQKNTYLLINSEKYGHIISPRTGFPSQNKQVGIITKSAFFGDIISTGMYNQTPEKFYEIMGKLSEEMEISGFLINKAGKIFYFNMEEYFCGK